MTHVTCRLAAKNRDQLRNPTLANRVRATFTFFSTETVPRQFSVADGGRQSGPTTQSVLIPLTLSVRTGARRVISPPGSRFSSKRRRRKYSSFDRAALVIGLLFESMPCRRHTGPHVDASCFWNVSVHSLHPSSIRCLLNRFG